MRRFLSFGIIILCLFLGVQAVQAGTFYLHEHPSYWWYVVEEPAFSAVIPSGADNYIERSIFGMKSLLMTITVLNNGEITTSNGLITHFYAYEATGADGKRVMLRTVLFQRRHHVVYLTLFLEADEYQGDMREYWIRAVNGFEWN